jgi:hypothetical protein
MAVLHRGIVVVWGITTGSAGTPGKITLGTGVGDIVTSSITNDAKNLEHINPINGELKGLTFYDDRKSVELEVVPSGSTLAAARSAADACPTPGSVIVLADSVFTNVFGASPGTSFICMASSVGPEIAGRATIRMTVMKASGVDTTIQVTQ